MKYKELVKKNRFIKENNATVQEIHKRISNGQAELVKETVKEVMQEPIKPKEKITIPVEKKIEPMQSINSNEKTLTDVSNYQSLTPL